MATKKRKRKINWRVYNEKLINRGSITFLFSKKVVSSWYNRVPSGRGGFQKVYSDTAIEVLSLIRFQYKLTLRSVQGFAKSLFKLSGFRGIRVPHFATLSRRLGKSKISLSGGKRGGRSGKAKENIYVVVDSTGLKVFGEGEWKVRQHGYSKRRTWKKLHLCVDEKDSEIISVSLTDNSFKDNELLPDMLEGSEAQVSCVSGDGAYDASNCWDFCRSSGIRGIFPPRRGARIQRHGNRDGPSLDRDEHIRMIRRRGRKRWKEESGYSRRSLAETAVYRFKALFGDRLFSRKFDCQANEAFLKCKLLNMMAVPKVL